MKAAAVDYARPRSLVEALDLLARAGAEARVMAGGQSLVAMMNLRVAAPSLVIDISRLPALVNALDDGNSVTFGACVTHAAIEDWRVPDPSRGLMPRVAQTLAYRAIRTRGTIGGSLALADPAAEWPAVLTALDAEAILAGAGGRRTVKCADFITGICQTRLGDGEIVEMVRVPKLSEAARWGYLKLARKSGEFALSLAVAVHDAARNYARIVLGATDGAPLRLDETARLCAGGPPEPDALSQAIAADLDRAADRHFDAFRRNLHAVAATRVVRQALA
jgi:aerobic carbon-monoxide dehydrogenase medium subunit